MSAPLSPRHTAERQWAQFYLLTRSRPLADSTVLPEHISQPRIRRWYEIASKHVGPWSHLDLGISTDEIGELELSDWVPAHRVPGLEQLIIDSWRVERMRIHCDAFLGSTSGNDTRKLASDLEALQGACAEAIAGGSSTARSHYDVGTASFKRWVEAASAPEPTTLPFPWPKLQASTHGVPLRKLVIIGARSSEHKTTVARSLAVHWSQTMPVLFWTAEDDAEDIAGRTFCADTPGLTTTAMSTGGWPKGSQRPDDYAMTQIMGGVRKSLEGPTAKHLHYIDTPNPTESEIFRALSVAVVRLGIKAFVFDFLQLAVPDNGAQPTQHWWRMFIAKLAGFAKRHNVAAIVTSQVEKTGSKESLEQGRIPTMIEMPYGSVLRDGCYGCLMLGANISKDGNRYLRINVDKWKGAARDISLNYAVDAPHDTLREL